MSKWALGTLGGLILAFLFGKKAKAKPTEDPPEDPGSDEGEGTEEEVIEPDPPPLDGDWIPPGEGNPVRALVAGDAKNPEIAALLAELDDYMESNGVDLSTVSAKELTRMKTGKHAIPPRALWPNIVPTLILWQERIRNPLGFPMKLGGYRPVDYNKAVGGAPRSQHQWFAAIDVRPASSHNTAENRRKVALAGAQVYADSSPSLAVGFGAYGAPTPSNIHLDTRFRHRKWREADHYLDQIGTS